MHRIYISIYSLCLAFLGIYFLIDNVRDQNLLLISKIPISISVVVLSSFSLASIVGLQTRRLWGYWTAMPFALFVALAGLLGVAFGFSDKEDTIQGTLSFGLFLLLALSSFLMIFDYALGFDRERKDG
jgi:hypothetical protein